MAVYNRVESLIRTVGITTTDNFSLRGGSYWVETAFSFYTLFTMGTNPTTGQNLVLGTVTYLIKSTMTQANDIQLGGTAPVTLANIIATINGTGVSGTTYFAGTVSPAAAVRAAPQTTAQVAANAVNFYSVVTGSTGNLTSTTNITSATLTGAAFIGTGVTQDLKRLSPDGATYIARITQITASPGQQTITLPGGVYQWVTTGSPNQYLEITRAYGAVE